MLVLARKLDERINLHIKGEHTANGEPILIQLTVVEHNDWRIRLGLQAPKCVRILREELEGAA